MWLRQIIISVIVHFLFTNAWEIQLNPSEDALQNREAGENFFLICKVKHFDGGASDVKIEWYHDDQLIQKTGSTMSIERPFQNQLMMVRPTINDGGKYTCRASIADENKEVTAEISFVDPPKFINPQTEQHPEEGQTAEITCEIEATDSVEVFWQFNGISIDDSLQRGYKFSENLQTLMIPNYVASKDDGIYSCNAAQYSAFKTLPINVTGYARPTITVFDVPLDNTALEGHTIELKCGAIGKPKPSYTWFFEGEEVPSARTDKRNVDSGLLIIEFLNTEDAGTYKCVASNVVGNVSQSFDLSVFMKPKVDVKSEQNEKANSNVEVHCNFEAEGNVTAKFRYGSKDFVPEVEEKEEEEDEETTTQSSQQTNEHSNENEGSEGNSEELTTSYLKTEESEENSEPVDIPVRGDNERISVTKSDGKVILKILQISSEDAGDYECIVSNEAGVTKKTARVNIIHAPILRHYSGDVVKSFAGNVIAIYCEVSAVPAPSWKWIKDGNRVEANGATVTIDSDMTVSKLTLHHTDDTVNFGTYKCIAENRLGQIEQDIQVEYVERPQTPSGLNCKKIIYPNYGKCSFDEEIYNEQKNRPQNIEFLVAKLEEMGSAYNWNEAQSHIIRFSDEMVIPELSCNTQYVVKARAHNEAGSSEYGEETSLETTDPWTPQAPQTLGMKCSEYCIVSWSTPNDNGSPILMYSLTIQEIKRGVKEQDEIAEVIRSDEEDDKEEDDEVDHTTENSIVLSSSEETETPKPVDEESEEDEPVESETEEPIEGTTTESSNKDEVVGSPFTIEVAPTENSVQLTSIKAHSYYKISILAINEIGRGEAHEIEHQTDESPTKYHEDQQSKLFIIALAIGLIFVFFVIDLGCYLTNRCGIISCICLNILGTSSSRKQRDVESGRGGPESNRLISPGGRQHLS